MTTTASLPTPERDRNYPGVGNWPVLARLPDVSDDLPNAAQHHSATGSALRNYRFDPPENSAPGSRPECGISAEHAHLQTQKTEGPLTYSPPQPHLSQRAIRVDYPPRSRHGESPILPRSDLFSIPDRSLHGTLAPLVRFILLVLLFTVAGTMVLTMGRSNQPAPKEIAPPTAAVKQSLKLAPANDTTTPIDGVLAAPTAAGPVGAAPAPHVKVPSQATAIANGIPTTISSHQCDENSTHAVRETAEPPADATAPELNVPLLPFSGAEASRLPRAQTSQPPPAIARLRGIIEEIPTRQAKNDDDEPSLY